MGNSGIDSDAVRALTDKITESIGSSHKPSKLKSLTISYTPAMAHFGPSLRDNNRSITSLDLSYNGIGDSGACCLGEVLQKNGTLRHLALNGNGIGDIGACSLAVNLLESDTSHVEKLLLWRNNIGDAGFVAFAEAVRTNRRVKCLILTKNKTGQVRGQAALKELCEDFAAADNFHRTLWLCSRRNFGIVVDSGMGALRSTALCYAAANAGDERSVDKERVPKHSGVHAQSFVHR
jgi:hypothetical protein